ncbi:MAG TPA: alpha/beta hydrolase [Burkholderiaceae bacterium]|nr:alpha/beta hydrolase [Burkholderiaceae bacterium]
MKKTHIRPSDLRGLGRLTTDAVAGLTHLVEALHRNIIRAPGVLGTPASGPTTGITGLVYRSIRGVNKLVGGGLDAVLAQLVPLLGAKSPSQSSPAREAVLAALNGVLGDYLVDTQSPLAIPMTLRHDGQPLELQRQALAAAIPQPSSKLLVLVHGLCMNDLQWNGPAASEQERARGATDDEAANQPARLAHELGYTPVYLHYNSGRHISTNGRAFADLLEGLVRQWPVPVEELVIMGHSMGGLVARSACHYAAMAGHDWLRYLSKLVFLGTPHHGAPLERGGNWVDLLLGVSPYTVPFARLGKIRSAGITDLRHGNLLDEDWQGRDRFEHSADRPRAVPLPTGVSCYAIAATTGKQAGDLGDRLLGDGLVPVKSALGRHEDSSLSLPFPASRQWIGYGMNHLEMLRRPAVYEQVKRWLASRSVRAS